MLEIGFGSVENPLSPALSPLVPRGARETERTDDSLAAMQCPKGCAASRRSTATKPLASPEVADIMQLVVIYREIPEGIRVILVSHHRRNPEFGIELNTAT